MLVVEKVRVGWWWWCGEEAKSRLRRAKTTDELESERLNQETWGDLNMEVATRFAIAKPDDATVRSGVTQNYGANSRSVPLSGQCGQQGAMCSLLIRPMTAELATDTA
jgi:hypothetical protein